MTPHPGTIDSGGMNTGTHQRESRERRFRIWVAGRLDDRFVEGLLDAELSDRPDGSLIEGPFIDQSYLRGILDRLWQLGIEVRKFETYLTDPTESRIERSEEDEA